MNQFESVFWLKREVEKSPISLIWLENRRTFSFNNNSNNNNACNTNPFVTKSFHLNFVPSGRLSFLLISSDGSIEIFIQNTQNSSIDFDVLMLKAVETTETTEVLMGSFAYQRPNGTILIFLKTRDHFTVSQLSQISDGLELKFKSEIKSQNYLKFFWSESKEFLIQLEILGKSLKMTQIPLNSTITSKTIDLPFEIDEISHSSRAANYLFLQSKMRILILNLNGEIVKQLYLEPDAVVSDVVDDDFRFQNIESPESSASECSLLISPNGLVIGRISFEFDDFPILIYSTIGEITTKSKTHQL